MTELKSSTDSPNNSVKSDINLDRILTDEVGLGKYQVKAIALCGLITFFVGCSEMSYVFTAARIKTRCLIPECESRNDHDFSPSWISNAVPTFGQSFDNCQRFPFSNSSQFATPESCQPNMFDRNSIVNCKEYSYEHNNSAVYEFNLACDEWRWFFIGSSQVLGSTISLPIVGLIADRWGRRIALCICLCNYAWINTITYWSSSYIGFILCGFFGSFFGVSSYSGAFVLGLELVAPKHRMVTSSILASCYSLGSIVLGLVAWLEFNWRHLILIIYLPMFVNIILYWIMPESVRWLISKNRFKDSKEILIKAAIMNGRILSDETIKSFPEDNIGKVKREINEVNVLCLVFEHKAILLRCFIATIWWTTVSFINNSLIISSVGISGNHYVNFCAVAAVSIPAFWFAAYFMDRIGRKPVLIGVFWVSAVIQLGNIFVPKGYHALSLCTYLVTKFCIAVVMGMMYTYTAELFPTSHRSSLMTFASMVGNLGAFAAPITPALASQVWEHLPFILFASMAFLSGLLVLLAPETLGITLPATMEDAVHLDKNTPSLFMGLCRRALSKKQCYSLR